MIINSQNKQIINYLKRGKSITPIEALNRFGCFRLSGRIHNLRNGDFDGTHYKIRTVIVKRGEKRVASYNLST